MNHSVKIKCTSTEKDQTPAFYHTITVNGKYVSDGLREEIDSWEPKDPVMIDASTGRGKNTFVLDDCITKALQKDKNILLISNRVALSTQQKLLIMKKINSPKQYTLTDRGVLEEENFGNVKVITYHRLKSFIREESNKKWCQNLLFVIMDECHFFVADCLFNEHCGYYLNKIIQHFSHAIRVYLTATSWDVLYPLAEAEKRKYRQFERQINWEPPRRFLRYYFPRNFDNYKLNFFLDIDELKYLIESSKDEKWLIFVDSKDKGKELKDKLDISSDYLDAECKGSVTWKKIVDKSCFDKQVLISTSVLDNGINIVDDNLKNIVVFTDSRTSLLQMIGRKRCSDKEIVNVWVHDMPLTKAQRIYLDYLNLYSWYKEFDNCYNESDRNKLAQKIWCSENNRLRKLFGISNGQLFENKIARFCIDRKLAFYKDIVEEKTTFQNEVQLWLDKKLEKPKRYSDKLNDFCVNHLGRHLTDAECKELRFLIVKSYEDAGNKEAQRSRLGDLKERALNTRLSALGFKYQIDNVKQQWILSELEADFD